MSLVVPCSSVGCASRGKITLRYVNGASACASQTVAERVRHVRGLIIRFLTALYSSEKPFPPIDLKTLEGSFPNAMPLEPVTDTGRDLRRRPGTFEILATIPDGL